MNLPNENEKKNQTLITGVNLKNPKPPKQRSSPPKRAPSAAITKRLKIADNNEQGKVGKRKKSLYERIQFTENEEKDKN